MSRLPPHTQLRYSGQEECPHKSKSLLTSPTHRPYIRVVEWSSSNGDLWVTEASGEHRSDATSSQFRLLGLDVQELREQLRTGVGCWQRRRGGGSWRTLLYTLATEKTA